jgi:hypothetical protein
MADELSIPDTLATHNPIKVKEVFATPQSSPLLKKVVAYDVLWGREESTDTSRKTCVQKNVQINNFLLTRNDQIKLSELIEN